MRFVKPLFALICIFAISKAASAQRPGDSGGYVNNVVQLALNVSIEQLTEAKGKHVCQNVITKDMTYAKNIEEAHAKSVLLCIRKKCDTIQSEVNAEIDRMRSQSPEAILDLLASQGKGDVTEQVLGMLMSGNYGGATSCQSSQSARYAIYDVCSLTAYECGKLKKSRK